MTMVNDGGRLRRLARFRADPSKVRVAIRREGTEWLVIIATRSDDRLVARHGRSPIKTLVRTLRAAADMDMPGIDLAMSWAYDHPQHAITEA
jgi:hypothetical protein